ncbi:MAG: GDSL-like Lipase/Acylhydrolase [Verrucomicrobia bacterium]|nr:GDSL-like Lipase/Acylhydrolase [Verrucomicrobiota bacterium]
MLGLVSALAAPAPAAGVAEDGHIDASAPFPGKDDGSFLARHAKFLERARAGPIGLLFLGDSITAHWANVPHIWNAYFGQYAPANFGSASDATQNILWRIEHGELDGIHPRVVVLMAGTNNTAGNSATEIFSAEKKIVDLVLKKISGAKVLLLGILPRGVRRNKDGSIDTGEERMRIIREVNAGLATLDDGAAVRFLDFGDRFLGQDGRIPFSLMPDQLHPSAAGYQLWADAMNPLLESMMRDRANPLATFPPRR